MYVTTFQLSEVSERDCDHRNTYGSKAMKTG